MEASSEDQTVLNDEDCSYNSSNNFGNWASKWSPQAAEKRSFGRWNGIVSEFVCGSVFEKIYPFRVCNFKNF